MSAYRDAGTKELVLHCLKGNHRETYTLSAISLTYEWKSEASSGNQSWALSELAPHVERRAGRGHASGDRLGLGLFLLGLAVVFRFSVVDAAVPLLTPFLAVAGAVVAIHYLRARRTMEISVIT